jgi:cytidylate kinase
MAVICFSGPDGARMRDVARAIGEKLGLTVVDEEIILHAAAAADLDPAEVGDVERRRSFIQRALHQMASGADSSSLAPGAYAAEVQAGNTLRDLIRQAIAETAARGDVVIVAHAASHALGPGPGVLRVFVTASSETRRKRLAAEQGLNEKEASRAVDAGDAARADYLRNFYGAKKELPTDYDLVVNTDRLSTEQAVSLIAVAAAP